eukprot:244667_1
MPWSFILSFVLNTFAFIIVPMLVFAILILYFYRAQTHDNIPTLSEGYMRIIGHSYSFYKHAFIDNDEHDWIQRTLHHHPSKLFCLSLPFGGNYALINDIKVCEYLFKKKANDLFISRAQFNRYHDLLGSSILTTNGDQHHVHKTKCARFFTQNTAHFDTIFNKHSKLMIDKLTSDGGFHDMNELLLRCCLASFCWIYIGTDLNLIESYPNAHPFLNAYNQCLYYVNLRQYKPFWRVLRYFKFGSEGVILSGIHFMDTIVSTICESRKEKIDKIKELNSRIKRANKENKLRKHSQKTRNKYLGGSKSATNTETDHDMNGISLKNARSQTNLIDFYLINDDDIELQQLRDHTMNYLYASRDHLALWISWFFYEISLGEHKAIYDAIVKEIVSAKGSKYLEQCLLETLRLHPVQPWIIRECMSNVKVPHTSYRINRRDCIAIHAYSMSRCAQLWPNEPHVFKPQRWRNIHKNERVIKSMFFGLNTRQCLGKRLAMNAAKIYIFNVFKDHDIVVKPNQNITYASSAVLHMKHGLYLKLVKRE